MEKTGSPNPGRVWSVPVAVQEIPDTGLHIEIDAPAATRASVARLAAVRDLPQLSAVFDLTRRGARVHVAGQVRARVAQTCVVTLEPVVSAVEEAVDLVFAPVSGAPPAAEADSKELKLDDEPPEPLVDGRVDLGAIATELLLLGIDPYPRKAGAEFSPPKVDDDGARPFAALETLKKRLGGAKS
jgi:uncharacterized metal-binding protein YceD (DUF177 family)